MTNTSPQHHPDTNLLIEFASGSIDHGQSIAISAHLHYCIRCRTEVANLERIGGAMMSTIPTDVTPNTTSEVLNPDSDPSFEALMAKIEQQDQATPPTVTAPSLYNKQQYGTLPNVIQKMLHQPTKWRRITGSLSSASLVAGQNKYGISLQKISAGGKVPQHDHRGTEITVILKGSFSDEDDVYQQGDFLLKNAGDIHRPMASSNKDCLCLSVEEAPVKLTSLLGRMLNPFLRINAI